MSNDNRRRLEEAEGGWAAAEARAVEAEASLGALRQDASKLEADLKRARDFAAGAQRRFLATAKERWVIVVVLCGAVLCGCCGGRRPADLSISISLAKSKFSNSLPRRLWLLRTHVGSTQRRGPRGHGQQAPEHEPALRRILLLPRAGPDRLLLLVLLLLRFFRDGAAVCWWGPGGRGRRSLGRLRPVGLWRLLLHEQDGGGGRGGGAAAPVALLVCA